MITWWGVNLKPKHIYWGGLLTRSKKQTARTGLGLYHIMYTHHLTSLHKNSRIEDLKTLRPSLWLENGVRPAPFNCISQRSLLAFNTSPTYLGKLYMYYFVFIVHSRCFYAFQKASTILHWCQTGHWVWTGFVILRLMDRMWEDSTVQNSYM